MIATKDFKASMNGRTIIATKGKPVEADNRTMRQLAALGLVCDKPKRVRKDGKDGEDD